MKPGMNRRKFLRAGSALFLTTVAQSLGCDRNEVNFLEMPTGPGEGPPGGGGELALPPIVANDRFYLQSVNGKNYDPRLQSESWSLRVDGLVDSPLQAVRYGDVLTMPIQAEPITLQCIGNWIGGPLVGNAEWGGTPFSNLLDMAGVAGDAIRVKFYCVDGYTTSIPIDRVLRDNVLLTWEMNGEPLPSKHGYPVRLINPGHYGQKMPKWITRIELIDNEYLGYWESKPEGKPYKWSDAAVATVNSRIDSPLSLWDDKSDPANGGVSVVLQTLSGSPDTSFLVHGIAMAGERTVERVEVSTDGGTTWTDAEIRTERLPNQWVSWAYEWPLPPSGRYEIVARATDSAGDTQPAVDQGVDLYDGRTGWHRVPVNVERTEAG